MRAPLIVLLVTSLLLAAPPFARATAPPQQGAPPTAEPVPDDTVAALRGLLEARRVREEQLEQAREDLLDAQPERREGLIERIDELEAEIAQLTAKFTSLATSVDVAKIEQQTVDAFDLTTELESLLQPLIEQLKDVTEEPRRIEQLRTEVQLASERLREADVIVQSLTAIAGASGDSAVDDEIAERLAAWKARRAELVSRRQVAEVELRQRERAKPPLVESVRDSLSRFFRSKGLNLIMAIGAFGGVFVVLRFVQRRLVDPLRVRRGFSFYARLVNVVFHVLVFVAAMMAAVLTLFAVSDWVLLVVVLVFLVGLGWASVNMLPQFFEQIRLLLNLGSVRENERIVFEGLPWRVEALRVYTTLRNPALSGGLLRIPVQHLLELHSRPLAHDEQWFPCNEGDWVLLGDGTRGKVLSQTPDLVHLRLPGGGQRTYQTSAFLEQSPRNLSTGFRARIVFGVDYKHQAICTTTIPATMRAAVEAGAKALLGADEIVRIAVEFREAGASSLDFDVLVDCQGSAAAKYEDLHRLMARVLVDACNEHGWVIPFTQVTIHQAV